MITLVVWSQDVPTHSALKGQLIEVVPKGKDWSNAKMLQMHPWELVEVPDDFPLAELKKPDLANGNDGPRVMNVLNLDTLEIVAVDRTVKHGNS